MSRSERFSSRFSFSSSRLLCLALRDSLRASLSHRADCYVSLCAILSALLFLIEQTVMSRSARFSSRFSFSSSRLLCLALRDSLRASLSHRADFYVSLCAVLRVSLSHRADCYVSLCAILYVLLFLIEQTVMSRSAR